MKTLELYKSYNDVCRLPDKIIRRFFKRLLRGGIETRELYIMPISVGETIECFGFDIEHHQFFRPTFDEQLYLVYRARPKSENARGKEKYSYYTVSHSEHQEGYICLYRCWLVNSYINNTVWGVRKSESWEITDKYRVNSFH